jgi:hypothetical protein
VNGVEASKRLTKVHSLLRDLGLLAQTPPSVRGVDHPLCSREKTCPQVLPR